MTLRIVLSLLAGAVCIANASCSSGQSTPPSVDAMANRGQYGVGVTTLSMVDTARPTEASRDAPAQPDRKMQVEVWYPAATTATPEDRDVAPDRSGGRYPLIIFAHGLSAFARQSVEYTTELASHGYIVAAPGFPQSRIDAPGGRNWRI